MPALSNQSIRPVSSCTRRSPSRTLKIEYQLSRPIFIRLIGQYTSNETDALRDDSRTNGAILIRNPATGAFTRTARSTSNVARVDWLFSYHPTPGTVVYLG